MRARLRLELEGSVDPLRSTWQAAEGFLESIPFAEDPAQTRYNLLVALQELVTNTLRHGYRSAGATGDSWISLQFAVEGEQLLIELRDRAPAFDPTFAVNEPEMASDGPIPEGGYGLMIVTHVVDELRYERQRNENVLFLEKAIVLAPESVH